MSGAHAVAGNSESVVTGENTAFNIGWSCTRNRDVVCGNTTEVHTVHVSCFVPWSHTATAHTTSAVAVPGTRGYLR